MQFEQAAELNRHVDPTIPLTWAVRWKALKSGFPLLVVCSVLLVEQVALQLWLHDRSLLTALPLLVACLLFPALLVMAGFELQVRLDQRTRRRIILDPKGVSIRPAKHNSIRWDQLTEWRLAPLAGMPGLSKLTIVHCAGRDRRLRREWSMVLTQGDQEHAFLSEMELFRQKGLNSAPLLRLDQPMAMEASKRRLRSVVAVAVGVYLLLHGLPFLLFGLMPPGVRSDQPRVSRSTATESARVKRFVVENFGSPEAFCRLLLIGGASLTALGVALYFWGLFAIKRPAGNPVNTHSAKTNGRGF